MMVLIKLLMSFIKVIIKQASGGKLEEERRKQRAELSLKARREQVEEEKAARFDKYHDK